MKIIHFNSGLGNQIFQYMFCQYQKYKTNKIYGYYNPKWLRQHNGLEVNNVICGEIPKATWFSNIIALLCRCLHFIDKKGFFFSSDDRYNPSAIYYSGYWQDIQFYKSLPKPKFRDFKLNEKNATAKKLMLQTNSVSIHIRRGDYLEAETAKLMGNICTLDYYKKAILKVKEHIDSPVFFVFSDDIQWAKDNIKENNIHFIDWNKGKDSFFDMYLMSMCKAHIIANSSFSYWGAYMSDVNLITIYPSKWYNGRPSPKIAPEEWVSI